MLQTASLGLALVASNPEPPKTVNDQVIGPVEEYTTEGPAVVCIDRLSVVAKRGESVHLQYSGIHFGSLTLTTARGDVNISTGGYAPLGDGYRDYFDRRGRQRLYLRLDHEGQPIYDLVPREDPTDGSVAPAVKISGRAIKGTYRDRPIIDRIRWAENLDQCDRTYNYGWGVLFGDEPLSISKKPN